MGIKIKYLVISLFVLLYFVLSCNFIYASSDSTEYVRVGLTDNKFQNILKQDVTVYATAECEICDKITHRILLHVPANQDIVVKNTLAGLNVTVGEQNATLRNFVIVSPSGLLGVRGLLRKSKPALYHGAFEFIQKRDYQGFYLVNFVELQEYLKGVVPNEMPVSFGLEALKAQAVAARNYVLMPRTQAYSEFNVVDSVASQVYFGVNTESDIATRAVLETNGIVALYNDELILTLYSSTAGGYTENYSNVFSEPSTKQFPANEKKYLTAVPDKDSFTPLVFEDDAKKFYTQKIPSYDIESPYYRWQKKWTVKELEDILVKTLPAQSKTGFITPVFRANDELGELKDIKVMTRGNSGKAMEVDILTSKNCYRISKELVIRRVFQKDGISLPSANIVFEKKLDSNGNVSEITVYGGGFGHGVGMSQYGAGHMATKLGQPYYNILRHYYSGISLGTKPTVVYNKKLEQRFWAPIGRAEIVVISPIVSKINVIINGKNYEFPLSKNILQKNAKIDISRYIEDGENVIIFLPTMFPQKVYVEIIEKQEISQYERFLKE